MFRRGSKEKVDRREKNVGDRRPAYVARDIEQVLVRGDLRGQRGVERSGVGLRLDGELREALRQVRKLSSRWRLRRTARGRAPAPFALPPRDCAAERS